MHRDRTALILKRARARAITRVYVKNGGFMQQLALLGSQGQVCKQGNAKGTNKPEAKQPGPPSLPIQVYVAGGGRQCRWGWSLTRLTKMEMYAYA